MLNTCCLPFPASSWDHSIRGNQNASFASRRASTPVASDRKSELQTSKRDDNHTGRAISTKRRTGYSHPPTNTFEYPTRFTDSELKLREIISYSLPWYNDYTLWNRNEHGVSPKHPRVSKLSVSRLTQQMNYINQHEREAGTRDRVSS